MATGDRKTAVGTGGPDTTPRSRPPEDLTGDPLLAQAPRVDYRGAKRPALGGIPLLVKLGQGGMGAVYYGIHTSLDIEVAVKVLPLHLLSQNPAIAKRFIREAQIAASINCLNLIYVRNVGQDGGYFYQVMEYVHGVSAGGYLKHFIAKTGRTGLPEAEALEICAAAAKGLAAAHARNIIHRDVKPDNILIPRARSKAKLLFSDAKLADLGLARTERAEDAVQVYVPQAGGREGPSLTGAGATMGTLGYMPPEQLDDARSAAKPADVFALGATLYALLAGHAPFQGDTSMERTLETALGRRKPLAQERPDVSAATVAVVDRCLEKEPEKRCPDAAILVTALQNCLALSVTQAAPAEALAPQSVARQTETQPSTFVSPAPPAITPLAREKAEDTPALWPYHRALIAAGVALVLLAAGGLAFRGWQQARADHAARAAEALCVAAEEKRKADETRAAEEQRKAAEAARQATVARWATEAARKAEEERRRQGASFAIKLKEADDHLAGKRFSEAKAAYEDAKGIWPESPDTGKADAGIKKAESGVREEQYAAAMKEGDDKLAAGDCDSAEAAFNRVLAQKADDAPAKKGLQNVAEARLAAEKRRADEAARLALAAAAARLEAERKRAAERTRPWDGRESIAEYAKRAGLPATQSVDLGRGVNIELVLIPAGTFTMGSPNDDPDGEGDGREGPRHEVTISKPFYVGKYEVTVAQFRRFIETARYRTEAENAGNTGKGLADAFGTLAGVNWTTPNFTQADDHPVCLVSWNDAQEFCRWASNVQPATERRATVRLPTEAEWEHAYRAGTTTKFYTGNLERDGDTAGWFQASGFKTHPVGRKTPNAWGLYDMSGNVGEWCADRAQQDYYGRSPRADPTGPATGSNRILRGGSWIDGPGNGRAARRWWAEQDSRATSDGFRVVLNAPGWSPPAPNGVAPEPDAAGVKPGAKPRPLDDGNEQLADYAKRANLPTTQTLDLGNGVKLDLVLIPPGKFVMGSPTTEKGREEDEGPRHEVTISRPFYVGKYEVTQEQYEAGTGKNPSKFKGAMNPVENVAWDNAQEFCKKASAVTQLTKLRYTVRLPTEAEWEYACRAGTTTRFSSGDADIALSDVAWYGANSDKKTHPAGQMKPNGWGLHDMHGNVWEWCCDGYAKYWAHAAQDPKGGAMGQIGVLRGGCWAAGPDLCRSARRNNHRPGECAPGIGFRVVVDVPAKP